ncbi:MAG: hypothetical protein ACRDYU_05065 [Actinomycetes bacterium]
MLAVAGPAAADDPGTGFEAQIGNTTVGVHADVPGVDEPDLPDLPDLPEPPGPPDTPEPPGPPDTPEPPDPPDTPDLPDPPGTPGPPDSPEPPDSDEPSPPTGGIGDGNGTDSDGTDSDGPGSGDVCEGDSLSCTDDVPAPQTDSQQARAVPAEDTDVLADTGAAALGQVSLVGAALVGAGGVLAMRNYRGRHRRAD